MTLVVVASLVVVAVMSLFSEPVQARSSGIFGYSGNADAGDGLTCTACHTPGAEVPTLTITAPDSVEGGETIDITVTITGGPAVVGGFNASMSDLAGTLIGDDVETRTQNSQITHISPKPFVDGVVSFTFQWTAPTEAGDVVVYAAGLSANQAGGNSGDGTGAATTTIAVNPAFLIGDVNCSGELNIVDALAVAQFAALVRFDAAECPLANPVTELVAARGDINDSGRTDIVDALLIAQCASLAGNEFCPEE